MDRFEIMQSSCVQFMDRFEIIPSSFDQLMDQLKKLLFPYAFNLLLCSHSSWTGLKLFRLDEFSSCTRLKLSRLLVVSSWINLKVSCLHMLCKSLYVFIQFMARVSNWTVTCINCVGS